MLECTTFANNDYLILDTGLTKGLYQNIFDILNGTERKLYKNYSLYKAILNVLIFRCHNPAFKDIYEFLFKIPSTKVPSRHWYASSLEALWNFLSAVPKRLPTSATLDGPIWRKSVHQRHVWLTIIKSNKILHFGKYRK